jgi:transcription initiation factor TFIID subunit 9B
MSLASETNAQPLPSVPEVFGVRLPPSSEQLTAIDFNLVPNKPPPTVKIYDEEIEEVEESESDLDTEHDGAGLAEDEDQDEDMEPTPLPSATIPAALPPHLQQAGAPAVTAYAPATVATDIEMAPTPADGEGDAGTEGDGSDVGDDEDGLFAGGDDDNDDDETMADTAASGAKRKLVEEDDYD